MRGEGIFVIFESIVIFFVKRMYCSNFTFCFFLARRKLWQTLKDFAGLNKIANSLPTFFSKTFFLTFRVGADDFLGIDLNFLSIYKGTFRSFFPNGGKKQNHKQPPNFFFKFFFPTFRVGAKSFFLTISNPVIKKISYEK